VTGPFALWGQRLSGWTGKLTIQHSSCSVAYATAGWGGMQV
jgi:hypothetical protein